MKRSHSQSTCSERAGPPCNEDDARWTAQIQFTERVVQAEPSAPKRLKQEHGNVIKQETPSPTSQRLSQPEGSSQPQPPATPRKPQGGFRITLPARPACTPDADPDPSPTLTAELQRTLRARRRQGSVTQTVPLALPPQSFFSVAAAAAPVQLFLPLSSADGLPPQPCVVDSSIREVDLDLSDPDEEQLDQDEGAQSQDLSFFTSSQRSNSELASQATSASQEGFLRQTLPPLSFMQGSRQTVQPHYASKRLSRLLQRSWPFLEDPEPNEWVEGFQLECLSWLETVRQVVLRPCLD